MSFAVVVISLAVIILLISYFKVDAFLSFLVVSVGAAVALGIPLEKIPETVDKGIGNILGSLTLIVVLGAMLGKLVAESGAARKIASAMADVFGTKYIQWGLMITGFIVGIPLFYGVGFVLLVPLIFSVVHQYKLPAVYIGLPMLAALSVTHGFLPPHPSPVALISLFDANLGMTLILGLVIAIPAIIVAGPLFSKTLKNIQSGPVTLFEQKEKNNAYSSPGKANSLISATLPVGLLVIVTLVPYVYDTDSGTTGSALLAFAGAPAVVMLVAVAFATYTLGIKQGRSIKEVMNIYAGAVKDIAMILLIIAGSGIFKEVMEAGGVSGRLAEIFKQLPVHPLVLGWLITAIIRVCIGSATIAALTAAGVIMPLIAQSGVNLNLMVLSLGAGSLFFSHVNDSGFWLFKEYFNLSLKDTFRSWSVMETIVSVVGLIGVMIINIFI
jgi:Gnt-I system high-affinity gluconate transporter